MNGYRIILVIVLWSASCRETHQWRGLFEKFFKPDAEEGGLICNPNSTYTCPCSTCWTSETPFNLATPNEWVQIEFQQCLRLTPYMESSIRQKLAQWIIEECAFVVSCPFTLQPYTEQHVLIGGITCAKNVSTVYLTVLLNDAAGYSEENTIPAGILGSVVQAREHLLASVVGTDLDTITVIQRSLVGQTEDTVSPTEKGASTAKWINFFGLPALPEYVWLAILGIISALVAFCATLCFICSCTFICLSRIRWSDFSSTRWLNGSSREGLVMHRLASPPVKHQGSRQVPNGSCELKSLNY